MKTLDGTFGALLAAVALMCIPTTHAGGWETELPQPEMRQSSDGVLSTVLRATIADSPFFQDQDSLHNPLGLILNLLMVAAAASLLLTAIHFAL